MKEDYISTPDWELAAAALASRPDARAFELIDVRLDAFAHNIVAGATRSIGTLTCRFVEGDRIKSADFVLKRLGFSPNQEGRWRATADPADPFFWRREADFYASEQPWPGLPMLSSACCLHVRTGENHAEIILKRSSDPPASAWDTATIMACIGSLAEAQAMTSAPTLSPTSVPFLTVYYDRRRELMENAGKHMRPTGLAEVDALLPTRPLIEALNRRSERALAYLNSQAQVFSHNDFWQPNIFGQCGTSTPKTLIDFAYCGDSTAGIDAANFIVDGIVDDLLPARRGTDLLDQALAIYCGIFRERRAGVDSSELVRSAKLAMALKYAWLIPATFRAAHSNEAREKLAKEHGSADDFLGRRAIGLCMVCELIAEFADAML
ncbi:phosphotransferase [Bradyrhizobium sp. SZCCHNR1051]|uniref:phosphotransferase n=1 Tax=Bradyrhizobium sp. SZCCHNR1051 TaxID=3057355 RepID=UPI00291660F7|nr:phosphotransferase [Bradyrhizobium sp. SZCCHNR1051]